MLAGNVVILPGAFFFTRNAFCTEQVDDASLSPDKDGHFNYKRHFEIIFAKTLPGRKGTAKNDVSLWRNG